MTKQKLHFKGATQHIHDWTADDKEAYDATVMFDLVTDDDGTIETVPLTTRLGKPLDEDTPTIQWPPSIEDGSQYSGELAAVFPDWVAGYYQRVAQSTRSGRTQSSRGNSLRVSSDTDWVEVGESSRSPDAKADDEMGLLSEALVEIELARRLIEQWEPQGFEGPILEAIVVTLDDLANFAEAKLGDIAPNLPTEEVGFRARLLDWFGTTISRAKDAEEIAQSMLRVADLITRGLGSF